MKIDLDYGNKKLGINIPDKNFLYILETKPVKPVSNPKEEIIKSLYNPIGKPSLKDLAGGSKSVCIVISDITRAVPTKLILEVLLPELSK